MDEATWRERQADERARMSRQLWGRDYPLPDIPGGAVGPDEWMNPGRNELGYAGGYPVRDRKESIQSRAEQIMMENPGVYSPQMAIEMAEKEVPRYSRSEQRIVDMEQYFTRQGMDPDAARERAVMEEEDAWRNRGKAARSAGPARPREFSPALKLQDAQSRLKDFLDNPPRVRPDVLKMQEEALRKAVADAYRETTADVSSDGAPRYQQPRQPAAPGRNEGASLPLPVDGEVSFDGMPPVSEGLDEARVREVAGDLVSQGIPRDEAWPRAQVMLMRGPGRGGVPAKAPAAAPDDMWQGWSAFEGADMSLVKQVATHLVRTRGMKPDDAWQAAQVEASRRGKEGTTSTHAELDSRLAGGRASEIQTPNRRVPGPNDPTGVPTSVSREMGPAEQYEYNYRAPSGSGGYDYSQRDKDQQARGMVPIQTPDGVRYMVSAEYHPDQVGRDGVPGMRPDLEEHGYEMVDTERDITGAKRRVYKYTGRGAEKAYNEVKQGFGGFAPGSPRARRARIKAIAESGGMTYAEAEGLVSQAEADAQGKEGGPVPGSHAMYDSARDQAQTNRDLDRLERVKAARQAAMLAGGQPTSGPGGTRAFSAGLGMLPNDWRNQVMANQLSGGSIRGATPNDVTAAQNQQLTELGQRVATGQGFAQGDAASRAIQLQMENAERERRLAARRAAGKAYNDARWWGGSGERAAREALAENGYYDAEADAMMDGLRDEAPDGGGAAPGRGGRPGGGGAFPDVQPMM
jgi:hypothetical protein